MRLYYIKKQTEEDQEESKDGIWCLVTSLKLGVTSSTVPVPGGLFYILLLIQKFIFSPPKQWTNAIGYRVVFLASLFLEFHVVPVYDSSMVEMKDHLKTADVNSYSSFCMQVPDVWQLFFINIWEILLHTEVD